VREMSKSDHDVLLQVRRMLGEMKTRAVRGSFGVMYETADRFSETEMIYHLTITCLVEDDKEEII